MSYHCSMTNLYLTLAMAGLICHCSGETIFSTELVGSVMLQCCNRGRQAGATWRHFQCDTLAAQESSENYPEVCVWSFSECCMEERRRSECTLGQGSAEDGKTCIPSDKQNTGTVHQECCTCCKMGRLAATATNNCSHTSSLVKDFVSVRCLDSFNRCCYKVLAETQLITATTMKSGCPTKCSHKCDLRLKKCVCEFGYTPVADGRWCRPSDISSKSFPHGCSETSCEQGCRIFNNRIQCYCRQGFRLYKDEKSCEDVDECQTRKNVCPSGYTCSNRVGGYVCTEGLPSDYTDESNKNSNTVGKVPIVMTTAMSPSTNNIKTFTNESFISEDSIHRMESRIVTDERCKEGYRWNDVEEECKDINECVRYPCYHGYRCENTDGSYMCRRSLPCGMGFTLNAETQNCDDVDECFEKTDNCDAVKQICVNHVGSFRCKPKLPSCENNEIFNPRRRRCESLTCLNGYRYDNDTWKGCIDVDECKLDNCDEGLICTNTPGSYKCVVGLQCARGLTLDSSKTHCADIDECAEGGEMRNPCGGNQVCRNVWGAYFCECKKGYRRSTDGCEDVDECKSHFACDRHAKCINSPGSFKCVCKVGYVNGPIGCEDIDECAEEGTCSHNCANLPGSYECRCPKGFKFSDGSNRTCEDINECETSRLNACRGFCRNTIGSYECGCPNGFMLDGRGNHTCADINECESASVRASCNGQKNICLNFKGDYKCKQVSCPKDYILSKKSSGKSWTRFSCRRKMALCRGRPSVFCVPNRINYLYLQPAYSFRTATPLVTINFSLDERLYAQNKLRIVQSRSLESNTNVTTSLSHFRVVKNSSGSSTAVKLYLTNDQFLPRPAEIEISLYIEFREKKKHMLQSAYAMRVVMYTERHFADYMANLRRNAIPSTVL